jgi:hypothetical protein
MVFNEKVVRSKKNMRNDEWKSDLKLNDKTIQIVTSITYLGVEISNNLRNDLHLTLFKMMLCISKFCHSTELLLAFGIESFQNKFRMIKYAYFGILMTNKCTRKFLNEQLEVLKTQNYPEKEICTINQYLNLLKECASTNEILNLDYVELELNDCTERKYVLSNIKSTLIK